MPVSFYWMFLLSCSDTIVNINVVTSICPHEMTYHNMSSKVSITGNKNQCSQRLITDWKCHVRLRVISNHGNCEQQLNG